MKLQKELDLIDKDVLLELLMNGFKTQRKLARDTGYSVGSVNKSIHILKEKKYIDNDNNVLKKTDCCFKENKPKSAIILAAGYGMRMMPLNIETPKALLKVRGEVLIERLIKQLKEVGIENIYIVVGFMKEKFEYLIDEFGVTLLVNSEYSTKNNLHSLKKAIPFLSNTYILPSDIWCKTNPFREFELYSWYMLSNKQDFKSNYYSNRKRVIVKTEDNNKGSRMIGIAYIADSDSQALIKEIHKKMVKPKFDGSFWEEALSTSKGTSMIIPSRIVADGDVVEINTFEELRNLEADSNQLITKAIECVMEVFDTSFEHIKDINVLKKGMTNRSFIFSYNDKKYIMRIPGEGTDKLINREEEASVYNEIGKYGFSDNVIYINKDNGYKITEYIKHARSCNPYNKAELKRCIDTLKEFHGKKIKVDHYFDEFKLSEFYESLCEGKPPTYHDYLTTKEKVFSLKSYIKKHQKEAVLSHIDSVPDNFLIFQDESGREGIKLIDWEYASMHDPDIDIAMMCIYSKHTREEIDWIIDAYYNSQCPIETRIKIYCYISVCGFLWSNWCDYKSTLGVEFGEYSLMQYRYAKEYYNIAMSEMEKLK